MLVKIIKSFFAFSTKIESSGVFKSVSMNYKIKGYVPEELVRRLIESSHERFCSVGIMITRSGTSLEWTLEML